MALQDNISLALLEHVHILDILLALVHIPDTSVRNVALSDMAELMGEE